MSIENPDDFSSRPFHRRVGTYLVSIAVFGLAAAALVFALSMHGVGWPTAIIFGDRNASNLSVPLLQRGGQIWLYTASANRSYFSSVGGNYDQLLQAWRQYFAERPNKATEISELSAIGGASNGVLILASASALGESERRQITEFRQRGGNVLATWATGTRDQQGQWLGWEFLEQLLQAKYLGERTATSSNVLFLSANSPITPVTAAGRPIDLGRLTEPALRFGSSNLTGRYQHQGSSQTADHAVFYSEAALNGARSVLFGFSETAWDRQPKDIYTLIDSSLTWLRHEPEIQIANWPRGMSAAQSMTLNADMSLRALQSQGMQWRASDMRTSLFLPADVLNEAANWRSSLQEDVEIAQLALTPDSTAVMRGQNPSTVPPNGQSAGIIGFRSLDERYSPEAAQSLQKTGFRYCISVPQAGRGSLPFFAAIEGTDSANGLLMLPRTQPSDTQVLAQSTDYASIMRQLQQDFDLNNESGSLGILSLHASALSTAPLIQAVADYQTYAKTQGDKVWLTSTGAVNKWWRDRSRLGLVQRRSGVRFEVDLSVGGNLPVEGASFVLTLPRKGQLPSISGLKIGMPTPTLRLLDAFRAVMVFDKLDPGNYFYQVTF